jgi:haloalkane dehalogenase
MIETFLIASAILLAILAIGAFWITRDGSRVTPEGKGELVLEAGRFEAFPLPDYARTFATGNYRSYFIEVEPGIKVHMLEVGEGFPVYMQHGNPTSGLLYRKVAAILPTDRVRVIMPTLVGLGFSSKIPVSRHTLENHVRWIKAALSRLGLEGVVYVGQDWGGPVGMGALSLSPGLVRGAVIMNTGLAAPEEKTSLSKVHDLVKTPVVGEFFAEVTNAVFRGLHRVQGDPASMPQEVKDLYARPLRESGNAKAPLAMMRMVPDGPDHPSAPAMRELEAYARGLDIPVELVWGVKDPILGPAMDRMQAMFPDAPLTETQGGHFLQEEVPEEIAAAVLRVLDRAQTTGHAHGQLAAGED